MMDGDKKVLDIDTFTKLWKADQDLSSFESYIISLLHGSHFFKPHKKRCKQ